MTMRLANLSLRQRFLVVPLVMLVVCGLITASFVYKLQHQNTLLGRIVGTDLANFSAFSRELATLTEQHNGLYELLARAAEIEESELYDKSKSHLAQIGRSVGRLNELLEAENSHHLEADLQRSVAVATDAYRRGSAAAVAMATMDRSLAPGQLALANRRFVDMSKAFLNLLEVERHEIDEEIRSEVLNSKREIVTLGLIGVPIALILVALAFLLARLLSRTIASQIDVLTSLGEEAGEGAISGDRDELARIDRAIKGFRSALLDVRMARDELEQRVEERTQELRITNEDLRSEIELRKRAEIVVREREAKYQYLVDNSIQGLFVMRRGRILFANEAAARMFGCSVNEVLNADEISAFYHPSEHERLRRFAELRAEGDRSRRQFEIRALRRDGATIWLEQMTSLIDWNGEEAVQIAIVDITERKSAENQLFHSQKMDALGNLAGGIAHDFNNMLLPILALTELTMLDIPEGHSGRENLSAVLDAAKHAQHLVQQVLTFSRQDESEIIQINLAQAVSNSVDLLRNVLPSTIKVTESIEAPESPIMADAAQISSVIMNLGSNAADAMEGKVGSLQISLSMAKIDVDLAREMPELDVNRHHARLSICDSGCGMDRETIGKIFNPFFTTKPVGEGTGLGLAMVHGIVKRFGGVIQVQSTPGAGTTFNIYLPLADIEIEAAA